MILLLLIAHGTKAQYYKAVKGAVVEFDTAVVISIETYRKEGIKLDLSDQIIKSQDEEIQLLRGLVQLKSNTLALKEELLNSANNLLSQRDNTIKNLRNVVISYKPPLTWWQRNNKYIGFGVGLAFGVVIAK
jgi:hypothetical protein